MNKALAVQSARVRTATYTKNAVTKGIVKTMLAKRLHTTAENKASLDVNVFRKEPHGVPTFSVAVNSRC